MFVLVRLDGACSRRDHPAHDRQPRARGRIETASTHRRELLEEHIAPSRCQQRVMIRAPSTQLVNTQSTSLIAAPAESNRSQHSGLTPEDSERRSERRRDMQRRRPRSLARAAGVPGQPFRAYADSRYNTGFDSASCQKIKTIARRRRAKRIFFGPSVTPPEQIVEGPSHPQNK